MLQPMNIFPFAIHPFSITFWWVTYLSLLEKIYWIRSTLSDKINLLNCCTSHHHADFMVGQTNSSIQNIPTRDAEILRLKADLSGFFVLF
jgi:hypothetical protein